MVCIHVYTLAAQLLYHWEGHGLPLPELEAALIKELPVLSYPLSLITRKYVCIIISVCACITRCDTYCCLCHIGVCACIARCDGKLNLLCIYYSVSLLSHSPSDTNACAHIRSSKKFSFKFQLEVAKDVIEQISKGAPKPEDLILTSKQEEMPETKHSETISKEGLLPDTRLWAEVLRNLSKDIQKCSSFTVTGPALSSLEQDMTANSHTTGGKREANVVAFSCGHAFSEAHFELNVLPEFTEQVQNFPIPIPNTLHHLNTCYRKLKRYPSACPYCVFQHLRKLQLQECPGVPIKPWNQ